MVNLRQWNTGDAKALAEMLNNKKILDNLRDGIPYPYTERDAKSFICGMLNADKNSTFAFAIEYGGELAGSVGVFRRSNVYRRTAEIGYYIAERFHNKGIATCAVKKACEAVFKNTDIIRIYAEPFARNKASRRVLEKAGFTYEGTLKRNAVKNGVIEDTEVYALLDTKKP